MKKLILILAVLLLVANSAFALTCADSRLPNGSADQCFTSVTVASNETTLVSAGTVLVFDVANAVGNSLNTSFQVRVPSASANGVYVAGVAQNNIASGATALVLVRGYGDVAVKTTETIASGNALFVSTSGDAALVTSTTQEQLGFATESQTANGNTDDTMKAYITIV